MNRRTCRMKSTSTCCQAYSEAVLLRPVAGTGHENPGFADPHSDRESCRSHSACAPGPPTGPAALFSGWAAGLCARGPA